MSSNNPMIIKSSDGLGLLRLGPRHGEYLNVELEGPELRASTRIYLYEDNLSLLKLFEELSKNWKGWGGVKSWASLEGDFKVSCASDKLGHISFSLEIVNRTVDPEWAVRTTVRVDSGSLDDLFKQEKALLVD